ncbi:hypothetical protein CDD80_336 [Ophiocordyceps camponoti-rufipedis]|uniref:Uncharacterized protein n=1 Tax=Ophiocordyceps camponoti-rufipedis TaxID=2004952 RepID=A0A2C5XQ06_9HYPO|nr:hypothetical protein CDD80_336 [Ophiocordyceps camponoti-rufipedis]
MGGYGVNRRHLISRFKGGLGASRRYSSRRHLISRFKGGLGASRRYISLKVQGWVRGKQETKIKALDTSRRYKLWVDLDRGRRVLRGLDCGGRTSLKISTAGRESFNPGLVDRQGPDSGLRGLKQDASRHWRLMTRFNRTKASRRARIKIRAGMDRPDSIGYRAGEETRLEDKISGPRGVDKMILQTRIS